jgi:glutamate racemase
MTTARATPTPQRSAELGKTDIALRNLSADLNYLSTPSNPDDTLPTHVQHVVSEFAQNLPNTNPFMAAVLSVKRPSLPMLSGSGAAKNTVPVDFAQLAVYDAVKKDALSMLKFLHKELGGTPEIEKKIEALKSTGSESFSTEARSIVSGLQRNVIDTTHKAFAAMHHQAQTGLWSRTESTEQKLIEGFAQGEVALARALALFDSGHTQDALTLYAQTVRQSHVPLQDMASAADTDFYLKFGAGIGVLIGAGFGAAYTGGGTLYALTGSATATGATGIGAFTASLVVGGATFTAAEKFLNHQIFDVPYFATNDPLENALEFTQGSLKMAALMGYMQGYGQLMKLPVYAGTGAKAVNFSANLANEFAGLTSFTAMTDGPSQAFDPTAMTHGLATLLGLKAGNAAVFKTGKFAVQKTSDMIDAVRRLMPEPALGYPMLMAMPKWALSPLDSADAAATEAANSGKSVFDKTVSNTLGKLGDLYFGVGKIPTLKKIPLVLIVGINTAASFAAANLVRRGLEVSSNYLHSHMPYFFNEVSSLSKFFDAVQWADTWQKGGTAVLLFLGVSLLVPRIANGSSPLKQIPADQHVPTLPKLGWYAAEFFLRGAMGVVRLMGDRDTKIVPALARMRETFQSKPVTRSITDYAPSLAGPLGGLPDIILNFIGRVIPEKKAKFAGVGVDITVNSGLSYANAYFMNPNVGIEMLFPSLFITTLMSFANTHITQHQGFNPGQILTHRTVLGIGKGGIYGGICSSQVATGYANYLLQGSYGLFSMWFADMISRRNPAIGPIANVSPSADTRATLDLVTKHLAVAQVSGRPVTIVVVDSGLGGLNVVDALTAQLKTGPFKNVNIVYYNAVPRWDRGFNNLEELHRAAVLDRVLGRIDATYKPDLVLLTDHTLTTIYPHTEHAVRSPQTPVDVVSPGVDYITAGLKQYPNAKVVFMGGPVTINSGVYQRQMAARHIPSSRVLTETCPDLSAAIERNLSDAATDALIHSHAASIVAKVKDVTTPVFVSLNSSQFAFIADRLQAALEEHGLLNVRVVDPTIQVTQGLFSKLPPLAKGTPAISLSVVSQVSLEPVMTGGLGAEIDAKLPQIGTAVRGYQQVELPFALPDDVVGPEKN